MSATQNKTVSDSLFKGILPKRATTEWEDALVSHGIIERPEEEPQQRMMAERKSDEEIKEDMLSKKTVKELDDELNEDIDDDDEKMLLAYREKRIREMQEAAKRNRFGCVYDVSGSDYQKEITEASKTCTVIVHLYKRDNAACGLLDRRLEELAKKHRSVKFVRCAAHEAIPGYPERHLPTVVVYRDANPTAHLAGPAAFGGMSTQEVEWVLAQHGALTTALTKPPQRRTKIHSTLFGNEERGSSSDDDDSDGY